MLFLILLSATAPYDFEASTQGWVASGVSSVARSTARAKAGSASLAVTLNGKAGTQAAKVYAAGPAAGSVVTFNVWCPSSARLNWVQPYVNAPWTAAYKAAAELAPAAWNTFTLTAEAGTSEMGVQFNAAAGDTSTCYVDAVSWKVPDTIAPSVSLASPAADAVLKGSVALNASAGDNVEVKHVQFLLDGAPIGSPDVSRPFGIVWNTTSTTDGGHTLAVRATDTSGNTKTTPAIRVSVANTSVDTTPPSVRISAPSTGAGVVTVTASASDAIAVAGVQFLLDGNPLGSERVNAPYGVDFDTTKVANGSHALSARARDGAGNTALAQPLAIWVSNGGGGMIEPGSPGVVDVSFNIRSDMDTRPISPLIYGSNSRAQAATAGIVRLGGNRWTAYNWENNASNAGSDYCYQNDNYLSSSDVPGAAVQSVIEQASAAGNAVLLTVPIVDYVAADKNGGCDVRNSGANYLQTRFKQNRARKGAAFSLTPSASDGFVAQDEFVNWAKTKFPSARLLFSLDNEPDLWSETHAEIHPKPVGYDELVQRNIDYARAVKDTYPSAKTTGFVSYGFYGYVNLQDAPDQSGKGEFIDYYLGRMREAEANDGKRLIDYLDLHWYPEAKGGGVRITGNDTSEAVVAARVQAPRSLWDASYRETSWIADYLGGPINLLPREKAKIAKAYPGTGLAFTEWNFGGGGHISGAIATADVLGIFGRDGVGLATIWELNGDESFTNAALRAYRNFDGLGGRFGDTSMHADTSHAALSSVYASYDAKNPSRVVIIAINKQAKAAKAGISVASSTRFSRARVYTLTSASASLVAAGSISAVSTNAFSYTMPAYSVSVILPE